MPSAATDLGELRQQQSQAASFDWKLYYSASGLAIWLALIFAIIVPKANRDIRVLLILVPLAIVNILGRLLMKFVGMNPSEEFTLIFHSMAVGVTVLWLIVNHIARFGGAIRFLLSFATVVVVAGIGPLSYYTEFSNETVLFLALFVFMALTILVAMTLSQRLCGGKYRPVCFMLWLALWTLLASFTALFGFIIVASIIMPGGPGFSEAIWILVLGGLIFAAGLYVLNFPFMILGFTNPFFRERFCACLRLKPMPSSLASEPPAEEN